MEPLKNIVLAICLTINFGIRDSRLSVKPSVYLMPEEVFTNQANYELIKKSKVKRIKQPSLSLINSPKKQFTRKNFQMDMTWPDAVAIFFRKPVKTDCIDLWVNKSSNLYIRPEGLYNLSDPQESLALINR